ncbi:glucoamylase family protein [Persicobacter diffluens]|uniref:Glycoamylase-like domain-containing protein n=1 Tax=Persicobacter diffluens TaxID=981 RepID=A0AAN5AMS4_9BACT|nr:hypothetical protein PEDI_32180 [Persicobacter diffluens]
MSRFLFLIALCCLSLSAIGQDAVFFSESNNDEYYDTGLAFDNDSYLEQFANDRVREKIPVNLHAYEGNHSLKISWQGHEGGNWAALIIQPGWGVQDIMRQERISFFAYSEEAIAKEDLPAMSFEGNPNNIKSSRVAIGDYNEDIPAGSWVEISVPLSAWKDDPSNVDMDWTQIKAVILNQNKVDDKIHTMLIDNVVATGAPDGPPPAEEVFVKFFSQSHQDGFYDPSYGNALNGSTFKRHSVHASKLIAVNEGFTNNSALELEWNSVAGGDWLGIIFTGYGEGHTHDIYNADELYFWAYSEAGISKEHLPTIYFEADGGPKTRPFPLSNWNEDLPAGVWTRITANMKEIMQHADNANTDWMKIRGVIFGQSEADAQTHNMLVDELTVWIREEIEINQPLNLTAKGYDSHVELRWEAESDVTTNFEIYRTINGEKTLAGRTDRLFYMDFIGQDKTVDYEVRSIGTDGHSDPVFASATTLTFTDEELLEMVQEYTFRFFWEGAHPVSGMTPERIRNNNAPGNVVAAGGSGFGFMAIPVGVERGYISREQGIERMTQMVDFLLMAERHHGAYPHWMNGTTGETVRFGEKDDGADIVETALMVQGMVAANQYFNQQSTEELSIREKVAEILKGIEWNWFRQQDDYHLTWHWSPNYGFEKNLKVSGYNETLITYILAAAEGAHKIPPVVYFEGYTKGNSFLNGNTYYNKYLLPLGKDFGGPLFLSHYSFTVIDPSDLEDNFTKSTEGFNNYMEQCRNHTLINREYCIDNPHQHEGYSDKVWGLTASDNPWGYLAHEPGTRDNGTITPTAALGSIAYTPEESMAALKHFYRELGPQIFDLYGFRDAFNPGENWVASDYICIDQGPILVMIENLRTGLLWKLGMNSPMIKSGLTNLNFEWDESKYGILTPTEGEKELIDIRGFYKANEFGIEVFWERQHALEEVIIYNMQGQVINRHAVNPNNTNSGRLLIPTGPLNQNTFIIAAKFKNQKRISTTRIFGGL